MRFIFCHLWDVDHRRAPFISQRCATYVKTRSRTEDVEVTGRVCAASGFSVPPEDHIPWHHLAIDLRCVCRSDWEPEWFRVSSLSEGSLCRTNFHKTSFIANVCKYA